MQNTVEHVEETPSESEGLIKTPRQLIITVILAFLIPIFTIIMLVKLVAITSPMGAGAKAQSPEAIAKRIQPVAGFALVDASAPTESKTGEQVYESTCAACHSTGVAGAPKMGDDAAWAPLIDTGFDNLVKVAIEGIRAMPPRGGNPSLSDLEVARAVAHIANNSGASFDEPAEDAVPDGAADTAEGDGAEQAAPQAEAAAAPSEQPDAAAAPSGQAEQPDAAPAPQADASESSEQSSAETQADQAKDADDNASPAEAATDTAALDPAGEKLYNAVCFACHTTGVANAPKLGDKQDWAPYIESGFDTMLEKSIQGVGAMPPRGGSQASDEEMKAALEYILSKVN